MVSSPSVAIVAEELDFYGDGIADFLEGHLGFSSVLRAADHSELEELLESHPTVDLLAMDRALPGTRGADSVAALRLRFPNMRIAVFSLSTDRSEILRILGAGAHGFIPKSGDRLKLLHGLRTVVEGGVYVPPCLVDRVQPVIGHGYDQASAGLTLRQRQVLDLVAEGCANKVIARHLGISPSTVKVHVHAAFRALGVHSRIGAVAALRSGPQIGASH